MKITPDDAVRLLEKHGIRFFPRVKGTINVLGQEARFEKMSQHRPGAFMSLGAYSYSHSFCQDVGLIGRYCSIGTGLSVMGDAHPTEWISSSPVFYSPRRATIWQSGRRDFPQFARKRAKPTIGHDVWIGNDVLLASGITIGNGAVIAARAVVTKDVEPYAVVAGSPARVKRFRFDEATIDRLLASHWWRWPVVSWDQKDPRNISEFLDYAAEIAENTPILDENRTTIESLLASRGEDNT